jgi:hypothetical protein
MLENLFYPPSLVRVSRVAEMDCDHSAALNAQICPSCGEELDPFPNLVTFITNKTMAVVKRMNEVGSTKRSRPPRKRIPPSPTSNDHQIRETKLMPFISDIGGEQNFKIRHDEIKWFLNDLLSMYNNPDGVKRINEKFDDELLYMDEAGRYCLKIVDEVVEGVKRLFEDWSSKFDTRGGGGCKTAQLRVGNKRNLLAICYFHVMAQLGLPIPVKDVCFKFTTPQSVFTHKRFSMNNELLLHGGNCFQPLITKPQHYCRIVFMRFAIPWQHFEKCHSFLKEHSFPDVTDNYNPYTVCGIALLKHFHLTTKQQLIRIIGISESSFKQIHQFC